VALVIEALGEATFERAAALVAREQAAARQVRPELPAGFGDAAVCAAALRHLCGSGHHGLVVTSGGRAVAVMTVTVRETPTVSRYARLPAEGFAVAPDLADPTGVLAAAFAELASPLVADGVRRYYLLHSALPRLSEALSNLGFGRNGAYGVQAAAPRRRSPAVAVRVAGPEDFGTVARLALVELRHRSAPPMFGPPQGRPLAELAAEHRALRDNGAVHLLAALGGADHAALGGDDVGGDDIGGDDVGGDDVGGDDVGGDDVGLLTIELTSPVPRLCPDGQPYIGPTATVPAARGRGVGHALVDAALTWAHDHGYQWVSVDFETANPLSRPFWLDAGFRPTGYGLFRVIEPRR
jgi:GNAT superfamily N-acetyltransferase